MNPPDETRPAPLRRLDGEPVFDEQWQAQVLAMADALIARGSFSAPAWSETLGTELKAAEATGAPDTPETYYNAALSALETLLTRHASVSREEVEDRRSAWARAYEATPHGEPVELSNAGT